MDYKTVTSKRTMVSWAILNDRIIGSFLYLEATRESDIDIVVNTEELEHFRKVLPMDCLSKDYGECYLHVTLNGMSYKTIDGGTVINLIEIGDFHAKRIAPIIKEIAIERGLIGYYPVETPLEDRMSRTEYSDTEKKAMREVRVLHHALANSILNIRKLKIEGHEDEF